jgi:hypothetical protein
MRAGRVNKMECVRQAMGTLGNDATPKQLQAHLNDKFGLKMDTKMLSTYKGSILKAARKRGGGRRPMGGAAAINGGVRVEDIRAVKALVDRIGSDSVRQLAEVLAK